MQSLLKVALPIATSLAGAGKVEEGPALESLRWVMR
jgi:hypothetical protein